ncbi:hypothetical protein [Salegentibacter chungangensis]|uniref:Energy transducer TonB n=1 Tax=Salegentibacter chungangensis TaxID=1335724 RepID=A0ABW3NQX1_9FLAO
MKNSHYGPGMQEASDLDSRIKLMGYLSKALFLAAVGFIVYLITARTTLDTSVENEPLEWGSTVQIAPPSPDFGY